MLPSSTLPRVQDFRTGYYTLASPKALFCCQLVGAGLGVLWSPAVYAFYNNAFQIDVQYQVSGRHSSRSSPNPSADRPPDSSAQL